MPRPPSPVFAVLGPTGSGKSELALVLAETFGGEIISCDSIQVYRGLDIGSAKLAPAERRGIHHHLIDVIDLNQIDPNQIDPNQIDPNQELTAGAYARMAREALAAVQNRQRLPVVTGGTGFYLRALLDGLSPAPQRDAALRQRLRELAARRPHALYRFLRKYDPQAALRIHANDQQKLIRAVELTLLARQPATRTQERPREALTNITALKLGLAPDRTLLYERLNQRCRRMFEGGLLAEAQALRAAVVARGLSPEPKALQSLGYKQALKHLAGELTYEQAIGECQTKTRQYAKRQITWFRREPDVHWLPGFGDNLTVQRQAIELGRQFLAA